MTDEWEGLEPSSYQTDDEPKLFLLACQVGEDGSLRIAKRRRPFRRGWKLDETGCDGDTYDVGFIFHNQVTEEDVDNGKPMWPDVLEALIAQFKTGKTATLNLPWKRGLRVKPLTWNRRASPDRDRGGESLNVKFLVDNEDNMDREAFTVPTVGSTLNQTVEAAVFDAESQGEYQPSMSDVRQIAADIAGLINQPSERVSQVLTQGQQFRAATERVIEAPRDLESDPNGVQTRIAMLEMQEHAARLLLEFQSGRRRTKIYVTTRNTTIWRIAQEEDQDARELTNLNDNIEDLSNIPKNTLVRILA